MEDTKTGFMDSDNQASRYNSFLQRLKTYLRQNRLAYSEQKMGGTTVIYVSRQKREERTPPGEVSNQKLPC